MAVAGVGLTGCRRWPKEHLVPSTAGLRDQLPGVPEFYATAIERNGVADALLVTSYDGRPIKIEGNPLHPLFTSWSDASGKPILGASDAFAQASILEMYDPARSRRVVEVQQAKDSEGKAIAKIVESSWDKFFAAFKASAGNGGVAVLSEATSGVTAAAVKGQFLQKFPGAVWVEYEPLGRDAESAAGALAFNKPVRALYDLSKATTIVSLDSDLLGVHPNKTRHANDWSAGRRSADSAKKMNRLYIAESAFTVTGSVADHRLPLKPSQLAAVAIGLSAALGVGGTAPAELTDAQKAWIAAAAADLRAAGKNAVVSVGLHANPQVQALGFAINVALGAIGTTVTFVDVPESTQITSLRALCDKIASGQVQTLIVLGGNPVYDAPADLDFASKYGSVPNRIHLSLYEDETSRASTWHLPKSHFLEAWGDARAWDGTVSVQQPLILPLGDSKSSIELIASLIGAQVTDGATLVRSAIGKAIPAVAGDAGWRSALHDGLIKSTGYALATIPVPATIAVSPAQPSEALELRFLQSAHTFDGRYANNGWLLEMPEPITKLTWDNAALMNKSDADKLGVEHGDIITIKQGVGSLDIPAFVLWGQPKGVIGLPLGFGRTAAGPVGGDLTDKFGTEPVGFDTYKIRRSDAMTVASIGVTVAKGTGSHDLVSPSEGIPMDFAGLKGYVDRVGDQSKSGRVIREGSLTEYAAQPKFVDHVVHRLPLLQLWDSPYPSPAEQMATAANDPGAPRSFNKPHAWGMAIDMSTCIGCSACVVACQAENNIPVVGKAMVKMNRSMEWIRIDRYFKAKLDEARNVVDNDYENVEIVYQPMMCVHCENAPCEQVCPVAATVHDTEGLNTMVYNRCIGTRYCSNNCPYKVRRFNYMDWHSRNPRTGAGLGLLSSAWLGIPDTQQQQSIEKVRQMVMNPEVTVRMRGVMEKCTYCTQRIKAATIKKKADWAKSQSTTVEPKLNGLPKYTVDDFEVVTACQQACPTQAISFGNLMDKTSIVRKLHETPRSYAVLEDLNTRPRTLHLAKIRNQNDTLAGGTPTKLMGSERETEHA